VRPDDRFAQPDVAELTIALATKRRVRLRGMERRAISHGPSAPAAWSSSWRVAGTGAGRRGPSCFRLSSGAGWVLAEAVRACCGGARLLASLSDARCTFPA